MARKTTPTFIHELSLKVTPLQNRILNKRLEVARFIYNSCLGESLKRLKLMQDSKYFQQALSSPRQINDSPNSVRRKLFKRSEELYRFREYDIHDFVKCLCKGTWLATHIDSSTAQKIATRAYETAKQYAIGKKGRPRYRSYNRFSSVEGKSNVTGIRWQDGKVKWKSLILEVNYDQKDKHGIESHALACRTKYVRLFRRKINGKSIWCVQLVQEGTQLIKSKNKPGKDIIGLDIGPSTIAFVGENFAKLQTFCPELEDYSKQIKKLQKHLSRSQRAMNPANFESDTIVKNSNGKSVKKLGKVKKGSNKWVRSKRYIAGQIQLSELNRRMCATRKRAHGELSNEIIKLGIIVKTEKLSYKAFQRMFGKSVGRRAPGLFVEKLRYKAANAGGEVIEFNTRTTSLSQTCHCGKKQKKTLKERWHCCNKCGATAQRDLYSAFLARFVENGRLDTNQAIKAWSGSGIILERAVSNLKQTAIGKSNLASFGLGQRQSGSSVKGRSMQYEALDVVT